MSKKPDDATKIAGLASILQMGNKQKDTPTVTPPPALPTPSPAEPLPTPVQRTKGGKIGKYRDPNYHHYGFYLRTDTHKRVKRLLEDTQPGKDISELMQELLESWLASN